MVQNDKKLFLLYSMSQEADIIWLWFLVHMCKMMSSPDAFFIFSKFWFSGLLWGGVKGQKMALNYKKVCLAYSLSQEPHLIWLSFLVHMCKMMIFPGIFFIFSKFWFSGFFGEGGGDKGQKMTHNYQFQSVTLYFSGTVDHIINIFGTQV